MSLIRKIGRIIKLSKLLWYYRGETDNEVRTAISNLINRGIKMFPYDFPDKYSASTDVLESNCGLPYVIHCGTKIYFPRDLDHETVKRKYQALLVEQDHSSPHRYFSESFKVEKGDTFYDIGCAEGIIATQVVQQAKHTFVFECASHWHEPLFRTFEQFGGKATVVDKRVGALTNENCVSISDYFRSDDNSRVLKIDVEGEELNVLKGMQDVFSRPGVLKIVVCTYHNGSDYEILNQYLLKQGFNTEHSDNLMLFDLKTKPYLRRGVIRAIKFTP